MSGSSACGSGVRVTLIYGHMDHSGVWAVPQMCGVWMGRILIARTLFHRQIKSSFDYLVVSNPAFNPLVRTGHSLILKSIMVGRKTLLSINTRVVESIEADVASDHICGLLHS